MDTYRYLPGLLFSVLLCTCAPPPSTADGEKSAQMKELSLTNVPAERLAEIRTAYRNGDGVTAEIVEKLVKRADEELDGPVYTITKKKVMPPSGKANDYLSIGPYWWPDPDKEDGLPWIRRDGEVNPVARGDRADRVVSAKFVSAVNALAYASYFTGDGKYAERADALMRAWFIDPATRMNPHLDFAQGIPGRNDGRCFGIIEWTMVTDLVTDVELLVPSGSLNPTTVSAAIKWIADYLEWLQTSELGIEEGTRHNNHGTWYDAQVLSMLIFLDRKEEARRVAEGVKARIDSQIAPDGSQPHELERTKSLSYSTMNLKGFTRLAYLASTVGVDLWGYRSPSGAGIPTAYAFLQPYVTGDRDWTMQQLGGPDKVMVGTRELFGVAGSLFGGDTYCAVATGSGKRLTLDELLYPCPPGK